ncbi:MAG: hypothetical protein HQ519_14765 [Planctomycetes bacterium]|nr:hypothetical protein [Planctomycetota bacterium]
MSDPHNLTIYYHRDFDGLAAGALLAEALEASGREKDVKWAGVNFDRTLHWNDFSLGERFAVVDFHFHRRADYWFDHHPTTFLTPEDEKLFAASDTHAFDPDSPSCPPIILAHAREHWNWDPGNRFDELVHWSNMIDSAAFPSAKVALFGRDPALQVMRALTTAPNFHFHDRILHLMRTESLIEVADDNDVQRCYQRACSNRDHALEAFPDTMLERTMTAMIADLRSKKIRRERFSPFYLYPELFYAVTMLPTRAGVHITVASNPWNRPTDPVHLGELMKKYGGGGHIGVGGCNPPSQGKAKQWAHEIYEIIRDVT